MIPVQASFFDISDGKGHVVDPALRGKAGFFAVTVTWCGWCDKLKKGVIEGEKTFNPPPFKFYYMDVETDEDKAKATQLLAAGERMSFPKLFATALHKQLVKFINTSSWYRVTAQSRNVVKEFGNVFIDNEPVLTAANGRPVHLTNTTPAVSGSTGALRVNGGIGVIGGVWSDGVISAKGGIDLKNARISNLGAPINPQDAVNLSFFSANNGGVVAGTGLTRDFAANIISVSPSQPQVTVLGCITSGIWNATPITSAYSGTGVTNFETEQVLFGGTDPRMGQSRLTLSRTFTYSTGMQSLTLNGLNDTSGAVGTGTLIVAGGGSFGKSLYVHDVLKVDGAGLYSSLTISSSDLNAFTVTGGAWFQSNTRFLGNLSCVGTTTLSNTIVQSTSDSLSPFTGSWVTAGGAGVAKSLYVGETLHVLDPASFSAQIDSVSSDTGAVVITGGLGVGLNVSFGVGLTVAGTATYMGTVNFRQTVATTAPFSSSNTTDTSISTSGGMAVTKSLSVG
ncbi:hypothetical protein HDU81_000223, partial [Chytriomyces hyalinus]